MVRLHLPNDFNDNLALTYRAGIDFYNERNEGYSNKNGVNSNADIFGFLNTYDNNSMNWNHYVALTGNYDLTNDEKLNLSFVLGGTSLYENFDQQGVASTGQIVFGVQRHFNFENQSPFQYTEERNTVGVFGDLSFGYDNFLYLSYQGVTIGFLTLPQTIITNFILVRVCRLSQPLLLTVSEMEMAGV